VHCQVDSVEMFGAASEDNVREESSRRTAARGKLIGAGMAAQAAASGDDTVRGSKTCVVM